MAAECMHCRFHAARRRETVPNLGHGVIGVLLSVGKGKLVLPGDRYFRLLDISRARDKNE